MPDVKFSNLYPYTDFHELNLDWVIKEVKFWSERVGKSIQKIELTGTVGLVDTYTITYSDGTTSTFDVTNGNGIASVAKTGTAGLVDTYTITFQDGSTTTFEVHNGTASIDPTLTLSDYAADAKVTGDKIAEINDHFIPGVNLYNCNASDVVLDQYINNSGVLQPEVGYASSGFISLSPGTYTYESAYGYYGSAMTLVPTYDSGHTFIANITGTANGNLVTFDISEPTIVRLKLTTTSDQYLTAMLVAGSVYPGEFIPYTDDIYLANNIRIKIEQVDDAPIGIGEDTEHWEDLPIVVSNDYYSVYTSSLESGAYHTALTVAKGDKFKIKARTGAAVASYVIVSPSNVISRNGTTGETWGTIHDYDVEITITEGEDGYTLYVNSINADFIGIKKSAIYFEIFGEKIRDDSIPLSKLKTNDINSLNPLYNKTAVFDGNSICDATSEQNTGESIPKNNRGWAGRILNINNMSGANVGVSGGTITAELYAGSPPAPRHWLSRYIDTIYNDFPDLDYLILEGGTNDADLLAGDPDKFGTLDLSDYSGNFDDTTFTGALDTLFYKAINYYPYAKIGFIVAQKMGQSASGYDAPNNNRRRFFERAIEICIKWGIPYIDLWNESPLNPNLTIYYDSTKTAQENRDAHKAYIDGQHLTADGYNAITPQINAWMKTL